ncbi:MAG: septum formation protein Maf [Bacteroidia bacterium]|nr:septum formation protein Maf [Bacteroidia bacterium]
MEFPEILLASKSPRRHQLLADAGFRFTYADIAAEEDYPLHLKKAEVCEYLARHKAEHYTQPIGDKVLVTADTIVCVEDSVINKPADAEEAFEMLRTLSGRMHEVFTGVCLKNDARTYVFSQRTEVWFYPLTDEEILHYIAMHKPFDKAGAYGVQDWMGYVGVEKINGCFYNVMGFPVAKFYRELQGFLAAKSMNLFSETGIKSKSSLL